MKPVASVKYISLVTTGCKMMWSHGALMDGEEKGCVQTSSTWNMSSVSWRHQQQHWKIRMSRAKAHWNGIWYFQEKLSLMCFSDLREEFMRNISFLHPPGFLFWHHCAPSYFHAKLCSMTHKRRMRSFARRSFCFFWIPQHIFHFHPFFFFPCSSSRSFITDMGCVGRRRACGISVRITNELRTWRGCEATEKKENLNWS